MTAPVVHASFSFDRAFPVPPARVFAAFSDADRKAEWFRGPDEWKATTRVLDFREGGLEIAAGEVPGEWSSRFEATYHVIEDDARIVYSYVMYKDGVRLSVSLATFEFEALDGGAATHVVLTEQGAFFEDGEKDAKEREEGTRVLLDLVAATLT